MSGGGESRIKVLVIAGPTAVGKSALAEKIAQTVGGEIVSADSVQVYKGMDIGSNKPTALERAAVPYHLIDICTPTEEYNAADFARHAREAILDISGRGKLPIVVGGTGFYVQWLVYGRPGAPAPSEDASAMAIKEIQTFEGNWEAALQRGREIDPTYCNALAGHDWFRLRRVLEVYYTSNMPLSSYERPQGKDITYKDVPEALRKAEFDFRCFFLHRKRTDLFRQIDRRCELMLQAGLLREVVDLVQTDQLRLDYASGSKHEVERPSERAIGYRQTLDFMCDVKLCRDAGQLTPELEDQKLLAYIKNFQASSRQFVKRQLNWFRQDPTFRWVPAEAGLEVVSSEMQLLEDEYLNLFLHDSEDQEMQRKLESSKEEQRALKTYLPTLLMYKTAENRRALVQQLREMGVFAE